MIDEEGAARCQVETAVEMIEIQLARLRELIALYIRPERGVEPLDARAAYGRFRQWRATTAALLCQQVRPDVGHEFERRVDRAAGFARGVELAMLDQMDMAQQFLEVLRGRLRHHPQDVL
ncbi:MAG: hypothetical protein HYX94_11340 [Chloroflexi bacterium]|nr:hypothetical protein [Chloroflexota bacterium]